MVMTWTKADGSQKLVNLEFNLDHADVGVCGSQGASAVVETQRSLKVEHGCTSRRKTHHILYMLEVLQRRSLTFHNAPGKRFCGLVECYGWREEHAVTRTGVRRKKKRKKRALHTNMETSSQRWSGLKGASWFFRTAFLLLLCPDSSPPIEGGNENSQVYRGIFTR